MDESKKKENVYSHAGIILDRMIKLYGKSQTRFAEDVLGIKGPNISEARKSKQIPDIWFQKVIERFNVTREELCRSPKKLGMSMDQNWGNAVQAEGCYTVSVHQSAGQTMALDDREARLITRMRIYANRALWDKIEEDLDKLEGVSQ